MRKLWTILAVLAVGNLLALIGLGGWLGVSGRLSMDRMRDIRTLLTETVAAQAEREKEEADAAAEELAADQQDERGVALSSAELVHMRLEGIEADRERRRRYVQEAQDLGSSLTQREAALASGRAKLTADRAEYEDYLAAIAQTDGDRQFRKAVKVLDGLKAEDGAGIITAMIESGEDGLLDGAEDAGDGQGLRLSGVDRAVSYLNAMQDRSRLKLMAELSAERPELAAELLERLRSRGIAAARAQTP